MDGSLLGGRYRLLESRATGGMASVWRAADEETGDIVAVKRLHPHLLADPNARERLRREAAAMALLHHPNLVGIRAMVEEDEPALVMDLVDGSSLAELLAEGRTFSHAEALAISAAAADGLAAAHVHGIVHRDVKPANILVADGGVVRVFDFGVALALEDATELTAEGDVIGTLRYLPPERLDGQQATPASDVWGLGAVLFELLTGAPAFPARTLNERIESAASGVARPARVDDKVWAILERSLAPDPLDRFPNGDALASALHRLDGVPEPAVEAADPLALTEVIVLPQRQADADIEPLEELRAPVSTEPSALLPITTARPRQPLTRPSWTAGSQAVWTAGILAAVLIAFVVVAGAGGSGAGQQASGTAAPATEIVVPTPVPVAAAPSATPDRPAPPTREAKGKGKGHKP